MLTKNQIKLIQSLARKKVRDEESLFVAEGIKTIRDILPYFDAQFVVCTEEYVHELKSLTKSEIVVATKQEIEKASLLQASQGAIAVLRKSAKPFDVSELKGKLTVALDTVQDPGNLGTIIRLCDWFGVENVICSRDTADVWNPKVVQATMGAVARVNVHYVDLPQVLSELKNYMPVYGTFLEGKTIYDMELSHEGVVVMGNEGNGISDAVKQCVSHKLFIPNFPLGRTTSESLNVSTATAITLSEFRRR